MSQRFVLAIVLVLQSAIGQLQSASGEEINWRTDYATALKEAQGKGRPLLVDVGTENCYWCKQLDLRTFKDAEVVRLLNDRCVPLKIDAERNNYLVESLRIQSYPTLVFAGPDGTIIGYKEGFLEAAPLKQMLIRLLTAVGTPDWMSRDFEAAARAISAGDLARAVTLLRGVVEDGKERPVQTRARQMLASLEQKAAEAVRKAKDLADQGKVGDALEAFNQLGRDFPGSLAARQGRQLALKLTSKAAASAEQRRRQASEQLEQAREDYKNQRYLMCLDRCELLAGDYADLPEAREASKLAEQIKDNPEWSRQACDQLGDRLGVLYLALADTWLRKGQPQQAIFYLQRIVKMFPGSQHAEKAQVTLARLRGAPPSSSDSAK
jgi:thioredoxin-like negative regulator of GroEL